MKDRNLYMGNDINNKTIGIVGLGNVGRRIAKLCATVFDMTGAGLRSLSRRKDHRRAQRHQGRARRIAAGAPTSSRSTARSTTRPRNMISTRAIRPDAEARLFHHRGARLHHRREGAGRGAAQQADRRRRPRRLFEGAAGDGPPAAAIRQRDREPAHRRRHQGGPRQHGQVRGRATDPRRSTARSRRAWSTRKCGRPMPSASNAPLAFARRARPP